MVSCTELQLDAKNPILLPQEICADLRSIVGMYRLFYLLHEGSVGIKGHLDLERVQSFDGHGSHELCEEVDNY